MGNLDDKLEQGLLAFYDQLELLMENEDELQYPKPTNKPFSQGLLKQPRYKHESADSVKRSMVMNRWMFKEPVGPTEVDYIIAKVKDAADDIGLAVVDTKYYHQHPHNNSTKVMSPKWQAVFNRDSGFQQFIKWSRKHPHRAYQIYEKCILPTRPSQVQVIIALATYLGRFGVMDPLTSDEIAILKNEIHSEKG